MAQDFRGEAQDAFFREFCERASVALFWATGPGLHFFEGRVQTFIWESSRPEDGAGPSYLMPLSAVQVTFVIWPALTSASKRHCPIRTGGPSLTMM